MGWTQAVQGAISINDPALNDLGTAALQIKVDGFGNWAYDCSNEASKSGTSPASAYKIDPRSAKETLTAGTMVCSEKCVCYLV